MYGIGCLNKQISYEGSFSIGSWSGWVDVLFGVSPSGLTTGSPSPVDGMILCQRLPSDGSSGSNFWPPNQEQQSNVAEKMESFQWGAASSGLLINVSPSLEGRVLEGMTPC